MSIAVKQVGHFCFLLDRESTVISRISVNDGRGFIVFDKMQENVCIAGSETVLAVSLEFLY